MQIPRRNALQMPRSNELFYRFHNILAFMQITRSNANIIKTVKETAKNDSNFQL